MTVIKPKKKPVIQKTSTISYDPATFKEVSAKWQGRFIEVDDPQYILDNVKPLELMGRKFISFDTETFAYYKTSHDVPYGVVRRWVSAIGKGDIPNDFPFCISICDGIHSFVIYDTKENGFKKFKALEPLFMDYTIEKIAHNAKFDMHMFANIKMKIRGKIHDTVVLCKLANENRISFKLIDLVKFIHGNCQMFENMLNMYKKVNHITDYRQFPRELMTYYAGGDTWNCLGLFVHEYPKLIADELEPLYENELQLSIAIYAEERVGFMINLDYEKPLKEELQQLTDEAEKAIYSTVGKFFNINSTKQLYEALLSTGVDKSIIPITDKGNPSLDKKTLQKLADIHGVDLVLKVLDFRKYEKLLGTYAIGIYDKRDSLGRVHCSVNQTEATTGRMSIQKPALQTLPKKDKRIRGAFIPDYKNDFELWDMDLDQVEYRGLAHYAHANGLIDAIKNGLDIHLATASIVFKKPIEEITDDERQRGKTVNFSLVYGQGDEASAAALKTSISNARRIKQQYFDAIPEVKPFIDNVHRLVRARGYVRNYYGRRRRLDPDDAYKSPNALIQGWAADYIKHKLVLMYKYLCANNYKSRMLLPVHDEVLTEGHKSERHIRAKLRWLLSEFDEFRCPITAGFEYSEESWGKKVEPEKDIGFEKPSEEEMAKTLAYDVFNGDVFDLDVDGIVA